MTERPFTTTHLSEIEPVSLGGTLLWRPVRRRLGIGAFGVNAFTAVKPGDPVVEEHDELGGGAGRHEEVYFVASGRALFTIAGEQVEAPAGTFLFVRDPAARRSAIAQSVDTTVLAIGGKVGEPFEVSAWEFYVAANPSYDSGDYGRAVEIAAEGLAHHPDNARLLYNVACFEARAGQTEAALEHLRRAVDLDAELFEFARSDSDLDPIRDHPEFPR